jgi:PAS domain S-box-containing protein
LIDSLARSEASFRELVEQSPDALFVIGPENGDYEIIYANASMHRMLGYAPGALIGLSSLDTFVHPEDHAQIGNFRARRRDGESLPPAQLRWMRTDGASLHVQSISRPILFEDRPATLVFGRDITDRVRRDRERAEAEAVLRQSEERHRALFEANPLPSWVLDPQTQGFTAVNEAMVRATGYTREELLAMTVHDLLPAPEPELRNEIRSSTVGTVIHVGVRRQRRKDGKLIDLDITVHPIPFEGRTVILGIGKDVTHELQLEEQLRQTQKMEAVGQLAGGIAHDFNNILAVIIANAGLALDELGADHPPAADLGEIEAAASRAAGLTRQLLAFSRKARREVKQLALNTVVTNVEKMLSRIVGEDIKISAHLEANLAAIEGDVGQLEQVLMNLVVNARDAMAGGGRITIATANTTIDDVQAAMLDVRPGRYVTLSVSDTGCGMDEAVRSRIFEPFFTTKEVGKGTGLGLSTVFGIVKQSGGGIAVQSEVGRGTTFHVYFPRIETGAEEVPQATRFVAQRGSGTVLVVEDDAQLRLVVRRYLAKWGYTLLEAPNGQAALEIARTHDGPIDLLLTDLVMPEMDGRSLSTRVLETRPTTRVVFMSGYTEHPTLHSARIGPEDHFMQKPFTAQVLSETVRRAFTAAASGS